MAGPFGTTTWGDLLAIRTFDIWVHEQDVREALERPGGLDSGAAALAVSQLFAALPRIVAKDAAIEPGNAVVLDLTGPTVGRAGARVEEHDGKARGIPLFTGDAEEHPDVVTTSLTMSTAVAGRLAGGPAVARRPARRGARRRRRGPPGHGRDGDHPLMATFSTANRSTATVTADVDAVWDVLTDPDQIARLTPFLHSVKEEGEHWVWQLTKVPVLGASFSFTFRERMDFDEPHRIDFTHDPAPGADESAGVVGWYKLAPRPAGTHLETSMKITVDLPFPGVVRPAVTTAMKGVVALMGQRFSHNLLAHLGATTT